MNSGTALKEKIGDEMDHIIFLICLLASVFGGICGIGGGVIIKPVIDALQIMSISTISFLSGLTVLSMSIVTIVRQRKQSLVEVRIGSLLATGAVIGGIIGNRLFQLIKVSTGQDILLGVLQSLLLGIITLLTLIYSVGLKRFLPSFHVCNAGGCIAIGMILGVLSAFLGIGGGPINLAVLYFAFSMNTKKAAANSLYIIMFSQIASLLTMCIQQDFPPFRISNLFEMVSAGVIGGYIGSYVNKKVSCMVVDRLFAGGLIVIVIVCCYNAWRSLY